MSLIRLKCRLLPRFLPRVKCYSTVVHQENEEYTAIPEYPPILDLSYEKKTERKLEEKFDAIKRVKTVEEKQIKLNMPRAYGFQTYMLAEEIIPYNGLPFAQHATRTHLIKNKDLPEFYKSITVSDIESLSQEVQETLLMEIDGIQRSYDLKNEELSDRQRENLTATHIIKAISRVLNYTLVRQYPHIKNVDVDFEPRIESSWVVGGMDPTESIKKYRKRHDFFKQFENDPIDRTVCYQPTPILTLRSQLPLPCVIPPSEAENPALEVPFFKYDPRVLGVQVAYRHAANVPGFWPGDSQKFGLLSFHKVGHLTERSKHIDDVEDNKDALHFQAILSSYAWLNAQANLLGFTTYNDITYPLVTQTVLTNGKTFNFYIYQLNTITLHTKNTTDNPKRNVCWASEPVKLYEGVEQGKIIGFNEDALKILAQLYGNAPAERLGMDLTPYLSKEEKLAADYELEEKRVWLERHYKILMSNRPRAREMDEVYAWEKIYKIDFKTRQQEKRLRFFELFQQPWRRTLDDKAPKYVPRVLRPDLPKYKGRNANDYWP